MIMIQQMHENDQDSALVEMHGDLSERIVDVAIAVERIRTEYACRPSDLYKMVEFARNNIHAQFVEGAPAGNAH